MSITHMNKMWRKWNGNVDGIVKNKMFNALRLKITLNITKVQHSHENDHDQLLFDVFYLYFPLSLDLVRTFR